MIRQFFNKRSIKKLNNQGMTLTELIVSFALLSIFMVAATQLISYTLNLYYNAKNISYGMEVASMIKNEISGELETVQKGYGEPTIYAYGVSLAEGTDSIAVDENTDYLTYTTKTGSSVAMYVQDEMLKIRYFSTDLYEETDHYIGKEAYMGYGIKEFTLSKDPAYPENVLKLHLTLHNQRYGYDYMTDTYIKCYNTEGIKVK